MIDIAMENRLAELERLRREIYDPNQPVGLIAKSIQQLVDLGRANTVILDERTTQLVGRVPLEVDLEIGQMLLDVYNQIDSPFTQTAVIEGIVSWGTSKIPLFFYLIVAASKSPYPTVKSAAKKALALVSESGGVDHPLHHSVERLAARAMINS